MAKLSKKSFKGIHFIELKDLTPVQADGLRNSLDRNQVINLQIEGEIIRDCVQYHHYEEWLKDTAKVFSGAPSKETQSVQIAPNVPKVAVGT